MSPATWSDTDFLHAFLDGTLPATGFDHRGHVRAAWLVLQRHPLEEAITITCDGIQRLATRLGMPGKYHRTLTEALVRLMAAGGASDPLRSCEDFVRTNADLMTDARGLLLRHYAPETLDGAAARAAFVPPDRLPLPPTF